MLPVVSMTRRRSSTVVTQGLLQRGPGYFVGFDIPNAAKTELRLQPDGKLWAKVATLIPYKAVMTPVKLVSQKRFDREIAAIKTTKTKTAMKK